MKRSRGLSKSNRTSIPTSVAAFTLVELLVVIGIIALLISILLPALNRARAQAYNVKDLANLRSVAQAAQNMAAERKGYIQTVVDHNNAIKADPTYSRFVYRPDGFLADYASAYSMFVSRRGGANFQDSRRDQLAMWQCPTDEWFDVPSSPGYRLVNNVTSNGDDFDNFKISYGVNADICGLTTGLYPNFTQSGNAMYVLGGPAPYAPGEPRLGQPLQAKFTKVYQPATVMLFMDCGVRPATGNTTNVVDKSDVLYVSTNYQQVGAGITNDELGTLAGSMRCMGWLGNKFPLTRHGGKKVSDGTATDVPKWRGAKVNVVFCDGHAATVAYEDFKTVRVSPYNPVNYRK